MTIKEQDCGVRSFRRRPDKRYGLRDTSEDSPIECFAFVAQSSVLDEEALRDHIVYLYDLPEIVSCRFLTRGDSDVYTLTSSDDRRFYLKIYRPPHSLAVAEAEGQLTADLVARGFPVAVPVCRHGGVYATPVNASEGTRPILIWEEVPLQKAGNDAATVEAIGRLIGQLHDLTDSLPRLYDFPVDAADNMAEFLPYAIEYLDEEETSLVIAAANWGCEKLVNWPRESPEFGICHGDLAGVNIRADSVRGITLFDFGETRYTWRLCDFLRFYSGRDASPDCRERWEAFQRGYSAVRNLPHMMDALLPTFRLMCHLRFMGKNAAACPLRMGTESPRGFLPEKIQSLREQVREIPELRDHLATLGLPDSQEKGENA